MLFPETSLDLDDIESSPKKTDDVRLRCQRFIVAVVPRVPVAISPVISARWTTALVSFKFRLTNGGHAAPGRVPSGALRSGDCYVRVVDDLGDQFFAIPFASIIGKPHEGWIGDAVQVSTNG